MLCMCLRCGFKAAWLAYDKSIFSSFECREVFKGWNHRWVVPLQLSKTTTSPWLATVHSQCLRLLWLLTAEVSLILMAKFTAMLDTGCYSSSLNQSVRFSVTEILKRLEFVHSVYDVLPARAGEIIGGHQAVPHSRPYMAIIKRELLPERTSFCDGFLLNKEFVMTAAHCRARLACQFFVEPLILLFHRYCTWFQFLQGLSGSSQFP